MSEETRRMCEWALAVFKEGCLLGDIAQEALTKGELESEYDYALLEAALEGFLAAGGTY